MPGFVQLEGSESAVTQLLIDDGSGIHTFPIDADARDPLNAINQLLAHERLKARDHGGWQDLGIGDGMFQAAVLLKGSGRDRESGETKSFYYLDVNLHTHDDNAKERDCAESSAVTELLKRYGEKTLRITECNFMGGLSTLMEKGESPTFAVTKPGEYVPPCGSCMEVLDRFGSDETLFRIFPSSDGRTKVAEDAISADTPHSYRDVAPQHVWQIRQTYMRGVKSYLPPEQAHARGELGQAWDYLSAPANANEPRYRGAHDIGEYFAITRDQGGWARLQTMEDRESGTDPEHPGVAVPAPGAKGYGDEILRQMNRVMMEYAHTELQQEGHEPARIVSAIIRTLDRQGRSHFRAGFHVLGKAHGRDVQSNFNPIESAISQMTTMQRDETVTDIFFMDIDTRKMKRMAAGVDPVEFNLPGMGEGGYVVKAASRNRGNLDLASDFGRYFYRGDDARETAHLGNQVRVHVMMPTDPGIERGAYRAEERVRTFGINDIVRNGFVGKNLVPNRESVMGVAV